MAPCVQVKYLLSALLFFAFSSLVIFNILTATLTSSSQKSLRQQAPVHTIYHSNNHGNHSNNHAMLDHRIMNDRVFPAFLELFPLEIMTVPVWDQKNNLVSGGKPIMPGACSYPILEDTRPMGRCCLGAISAGGEQKYDGVSVSCPQNLTVYHQVQQLAKEDLELYPVQFDVNNPRRNSLGSHIRCDICRIVQIVASMKHKRFALVGDSVQHQLFNGLECELRRRYFDVTANPRKLWPEEKDRLPADRILWKYGVQSEVCLNVTVPEWMRGSNSNPQNQNDRRHTEPSSHIEFCLYSHYRPFPDMVQHKKIAESNDVVVINYGLHFLPVKEEVDEFRQSLESLLKAFKDSESLLMYRESSAQHFDTDGGEWMPNLTPATEDGSLKCVPIKETSDQIKWRTKIFKDVVANSNGFSITDSFQSEEEARGGDGHKEVAFLPYFDWTSKLLSLKNGVDCTHFCYTPHIYSSMWRHMRIALDRYDSP